MNTEEKYLQNYKNNLLEFLRDFKNVDSLEFEEGIDSFLDVKIFREEKFDQKIIKICLWLGGPSAWLIIDEMEETAILKLSWYDMKEEVKLFFHSDEIQNLFNLFDY